MMKCSVIAAAIYSVFYHLFLFASKIPMSIQQEKRRGIMRNHEITKEQPLLNQQGNIAEPGWSKRLLQKYSRNDIKALPFRIKEWDYYLVLTNEFAVAFTVSDMGYMGLQSASFLDFTKPWEHTESVLSVFPMGSMKMPENTSEGVTAYKDDRVMFEFTVENGKRHLICDFKQFDGDKDMHCDIWLTQPEMDTMVIATPWDTDHAFYYNQKINCMPAEGWVEYDGKKYEFNPETDFGTLDWGRGVWTYDNTWYWGSGNGYVNGKPFGFNLGYGFGNTSAASENVIFYDGKAHKLDDVTFNIPEDDYCKPWTITSSDGRFEMDFVPIMDRSSYSNRPFYEKIEHPAFGTILGKDILGGGDHIESDQHQVFGRMTGTAILDDGTKLEIKDLVCFAEDVHNMY